MNCFDMRVALVGAFQNGKSTLVNCLLEGAYSPTGFGLKTTPCCYSFVYGEEVNGSLIHFKGEKVVSSRIPLGEIFSPTFSCPPEDCVEITCRSSFLERSITLIDTPGFDADATDDEAAENAVARADLVVYVHEPRQLGDVDMKILKIVKTAGKKLIFILNCKNKLNWHPEDEYNIDIAKTIDAQLANLGLKSLLAPQCPRIIRCNPLFAWYALGQLQQEKTRGVRGAGAKLNAINYFCDEEGWEDDELKRRKMLLEASGVAELRKIIEDIASVRHLENPVAELEALVCRWQRRICDIITEGVQR